MSLLEYKCPNCAGTIEFDADTQEMVCPYCGSVMDVEALRAMDDYLADERQTEAIDWGYTGNEWQEGEQQGMVVYSCQSCAGAIVGDETLGATICPFCGNRVVLTSKFAGTLRPDIIIPFKRGKDEALNALEKHYMGKRLLPAIFSKKNHLDEIKGIYVPFWLFDAETDARIEYRATKIRSWSDSSYNYTETSVYRVLRDGTLGFDQVPVDGSKMMDDTMMESIEPYDTKDAVDFQTAYLAGFFANKYDVNAEESIPRVNERIISSTVDAFKKTVTGYTTVIASHTNIKLSKGRALYALLPVWVLSTSWRGQNFFFAMNGQTGKFVGDLPLDKGAYWSWWFKIFGSAAALLLFVTQVIVSVL